MWKALHRLWLEEEGQGLVEYVLIIMTVAVAVVTILTMFGGVVGDFLSNTIPSLFS